jgi:PAS domain S-box-containing protein
MSKEENRAEKTLTTSEHELRLLEEIPTLVWRAGPEGNIEYVNKRVLDYFGAPLGEVVGWAWMEKVHPDDVAFKVRTRLRNLESGNPHDVLCRFRGADGRYRWFEVRGESLRASDGTVLSWSGVLIDIDDRRKAEEAVRESEFKLRQVIDTVPGLLWSTRSDGEPTQLNQWALDYIGVRFENLLRLGWANFLHPDDLSESANAFYRATQTGTVSVGRTASIVGIIPVLSLFVIQRDGSSNGTACLLTSRNASRLKIGCASVKPISPKPSA